MKHLPCPACRLRGLAGFQMARMGAVLVDPSEAPEGARLECSRCGHDDDGNRLQQSPSNIPAPLPVAT